MRGTEGPLLTPRRPFWLLLGLAIALCVVYISTSMRMNEGDLIPPLDDAFIHFQYARRLAEGHPFSYQAADPWSSGATSLLWPALLAIGWRLGFTDTSLYVWSLGLGTVLLASTAASTRSWIARVSDDRTGWLGALLLILCGPLLWASFSGMEGILVCAAIAGVLEGITRQGPPAGGGPNRSALAWAAVLATVRPEGAVFAAILGGVQLVRAWLAEVRTQPPLGRRGRVPALVWLLPAALGAIQPALNYANTGMIASSSALAKANPRLLRPDDTSLPTFVLENLVWRGTATEFFGGLGTIAMVLFAVGAGALLIRDRVQRAPGIGVIALTWWFAPYLLLALFLPVEWHHHRYLMPGLAIVVPLIALGADTIDRGIARLRRLPGGGRDADAASELPHAPLVLGTFLALSAFSGFAWADQLGRNASDIRAQQVATARWLAASVPTDAVVAANDVGALAYLGERQVYDLEGIVSLEALPAALAGEGSVYAGILRVNPDLLVVFPTWFASTFNAGAAEIRRHARLARRTVSGGPDLVVATLDPAVTATAHRPPPLAPGERVLDTLDVSDLVDEAAHAWVIADPSLHAGRANTVQRGAYADGSRVVDSARRLAGGATLQVDWPLGGGALVGRFGASEARSWLEVRVEGRSVGVWEIAAVRDGAWEDQRLALPGLLGEDGGGARRVHVELLPLEVAPGPAGGWHLARLWVVAGAPTVPSTVPSTVPPP